jgi:4-amino-4-deoxy-L-arabinose transferase-like glycosyltransferase
MMNNNITWLTRQLERRPWLAPTLIFLGALAVRSAVAVYLPARILWADGFRYMHVAENLLQHGTFGSLQDNRFSVPAQPLLIAAARLLFGSDITALRLFSAVIGAATCVVGYALAKRLFGPLAALLAGACLAVYPPYVYLSALFEYPQTFFIFAMSLSFLALFAYLHTGRLPAAAACGLLLGVAMLALPTVEVYIPLLLACLVVGTRRLQLSALLVLTVAVALPVGSWTLRNYLQYGDPILVNRAGGFSFWLANNETYYEFGKSAVVPQCDNGNEHTRFCGEFMQMRRELHATDLNETEKTAAEDRIGWQKGLQFLRADPGRAATLTVRKFLQLWTPVPDAVTNRESSASNAVIWMSILSYTPVLLLGLTGFALSVRRWRKLLPIYAYFLAFTAIYSVFLPTTRYRLPLDFFLVLFSAYALTRLLPRLRQAQLAPAYGDPEAGRP